MYIHDLDVEAGQLESGVDSAQAATASLHKDWLDAQKGLSNLFPSSRAQKDKLERKAHKYYVQGEPRTSDHHASLMPISRSEISSFSLSAATDRKSTRLNSSHVVTSRMPSSA